MTRLVSCNTEYDSFLYAIVAENEEPPLSVLSMLSRLNVDPWPEAVRLARLPRQEAIDCLSAYIQRLKRRSISASQADALASTLVERLPTRGSPAASALQQEAVDFSSMWLIFSIFIAMMAVSQGTPNPGDKLPSQQTVIQRSEPVLLHHEAVRNDASQPAPPPGVQR